MDTDQVLHRHRVVVTGVGVKSPAGNDVKTLWSELLTGRSAIRKIQRFDSSDLPVRFAGEVSGFDPVSYLGPKDSRQMDRATQFGFAAAADAMIDAKLPENPDLSRYAVVAGTGLGGIASFHDQDRVFIEDGPSRLNPRAIPMLMPNATAAVIAMRFGWRGPNLCIATACSSGAHAIGEGMRLIREGAADVALAGGTEAAVTPVAISAFARMSALSMRNDQPQTASRPFDVRRDGFVLGEGAAFVVLENYSHAILRRADIRGEILGYGRNSDAFHITAPPADGYGAAACMRLALADAGVDPSDIGHINAHGTATQINDVTEAQAIRTVFGSDSPPVTSIKGATGHLIGAAGAIEFIVSLMAIRHGVVPPTANHEKSDPRILVDIVADTPRSVDKKLVLTNSFGFGGHNATLVLGLTDGVEA